MSKSLKDTLDLLLPKLGEACNLDLRYRYSVEDVLDNSIVEVI